MRIIRVLTPLFLAALLISGCSNTTIPNESQSVTKEKIESPTNGELKQEKPIQQDEQKTGVSTDSNNTQNHFSVPLLYVIDGDTIKVKVNGKEESVRFLLVDTPETHHPRLGVQPFGPEAAAFTKKLLSGKTVLLEKDVSERDKYGRLLMYVYTPDGRSVQEALLKNGLARVAYVFPPNTKYVDKYYAIQKEAQKRGVGIWSIENYARKDGYHPDAGNHLQQNPSSKSNPSTSSEGFPPDSNGNCSGKIKGNKGSNGWIYHIPSGRYYNVTKAEQCFQTEGAAEKAGYRKSAQ